MRAYSASVRAQHRVVFNEIGQKERVHVLDVWYTKSANDITSSAGVSALQRYNGSLSRTLSATFPEYPWRSLNFTRVPKQYWSRIDHQRNRFDEIGQKLNVKLLDEWNFVSSYDVHINGGSSIVRKSYDGSMAKTLSSLYPQHNWDDLRLDWIPSKQRRDLSTQRQLFDSIAIRLGIKLYSDWYITAHWEIRDLASSVLKIYKGSIENALKHIYAEFYWEDWKFKLALRNYWDDFSHQREYIKKLASDCGATNITHWHEVQDEILTRDTQNIIKKYYNGSFHTALSRLFPNEKWNTSKITRIGVNKNWNDIDTQVDRLNDIAKKLNIKDLEQLALTNSDVIRKTGGGLIIRRYKSIANAISRVFKGYTVPITDFGYLKKIKNFLGITTSESWYRVSKDELATWGSSSFVKSFPHSLELIDPYFKWDWSKFYKRNARAAQWRLLECVKTILPDSHVEEEFLIGHGQTSSFTLDIFVADLNLAFEYQGQQHYNEVFPEGLNVGTREAHDEEKQQLCIDIGITLILIPYWWQGDSESIAATIKKYKPSLSITLQPHAKPLVAYNASVFKTPLKLMTPRQPSDYTIALSNAN